MVKKKIIPFILVTLFFLFLPLPAKAVVKGDLKIEHNDPLFPAGEVWFPGKSVTKSVLVGNLSATDSHQAGMRIRIRITDDSSLSRVLRIRVTYGTSVLVDGFLSELAGIELPLTFIGPGGTVVYDLTASLGEEVGNDYQSKSTTVDFIFGFIGSLTSTPTPSPVSGGGGGTVAGTASPPGCSAVAPGKPANLTAVPGGEGEVILSWSPPSGTVTHYLIAYGTSSGNYLYGNPNVGNVTSYTVSGLSGGVTYYFVVKGVNDCAPGPFSDEAVAVAGGTLAAAGPAVGFEVLGKKKEAAEEGELGGGIATTAGETAGVATSKKPCFWGVIFLLGGGLISWGYWRRKKKLVKKDLAFPAFFSVLALLGDKIMHRWFEPTVFCHWLWVGALGIIGGFAFWWFKKTS
ncbi:fibronectin type III domain-containing protein [bacterium]|nr:fibronectin type III domain-containing protein [bacterium]